MPRHTRYKSKQKSQYSGSTFIALSVLLGLIPAHVFFLKYFEELELELRLGESYLEYKKSGPFLIPNFTMPKKAESTEKAINNGT